MEDLAQRKAELRRRLEERKAKTLEGAETPSEDIDAVVSRETLEKIEPSKAQAKAAAVLAKEKGAVVAGRAKEQAIALGQRAKVFVGRMAAQFREKRPALPELTARHAVRGGVIVGLLFLGAALFFVGSSLTANEDPKPQETAGPVMPAKPAVDLQSVKPPAPVAPPSPAVQEVAPTGEVDTPGIATVAVEPLAAEREQEAVTAAASEATKVPHQKPKTAREAPRKAPPKTTEKPASKTKDWRDEANEDIDKFMESQT